MVLQEILATFTVWSTILQMVIPDAIMTTFNTLLGLSLTVGSVMYFFRIL